MIFMNFIKSRWGKVLCEVGVFVLLFLLTCLLYVTVKPFLYFERTGIVPQIVCASLIVVVIIVGVVLYLKGKLTFNKAIFLLLLIGYLIRVCYMLVTPFNARQHDTVTDFGDGHEDYAWILFTTGKLPTAVGDDGFLKYQFYHPPLNAAIQALFMNFSRGLLNFYNVIRGETIYDTTQMHVLFETTQILALMYSMVFTYFGIKGIYLLNIKNKKAKFFGVVFLIFFPRLIQLSAQENNDTLCAMLMMIALYFTLRWWHKQSWANILPIALAIGLAMMAKLAAATVAIATAFVFIFVFIKTIMSKNGKNIFNICMQFVAFLIICCPLGLWFPVYAAIKFNQPFGYVFGNLNQDLFTGDHNFFERFINIFDFYDMSKSLYANPFNNYNIFGYLIKTSIFGEFSYWQGEAFAFLAIVFNYLFVVSSLFLYVAYLIKSKGENFENKVFGIVILITQAVMMMYFNIKMPYGCTMDFRYIIPIIFGFGLMSTLTYDKFVDEKNWLGIIAKGNYVSGLTFLVCSSLFYMMAI